MKACRDVLIWMPRDTKSDTCVRVDIRWWWVFLETLDREQKREPLAAGTCRIRRISSLGANHEYLFCVALLSVHVSFCLTWPTVWTANLIVYNNRLVICEPENSNPKRSDSFSWRGFLLLVYAEGTAEKRCACCCYKSVVSSVIGNWR